MSNLGEVDGRHAGRSEVGGRSCGRPFNARAGLDEVQYEAIVWITQRASFLRTAPVDIPTRSSWCKRAVAQRVENARVVPQGNVCGRVRGCAETEVRTRANRCIGRQHPEQTTREILDARIEVVDLIREICGRDPDEDVNSDEANRAHVDAKSHDLRRRDL